MVTDSGIHHFDGDAVFEVRASTTYEEVAGKQSVTENGINLEGPYGKDSFGMARE